jgi:hypothetical protein
MSACGVACAGFGTHTYRGAKDEDHSFEGSFRNGLRDGLGIEITRFRSLLDPAGRETLPQEVNSARKEDMVGGWSFYAGAWSGGRRHGRGITGSAVLLQEDTPDDASRTCLGHSTNLQFKRSALVECRWGGVVTEEAAVIPPVPEDELLWEECMRHAIKAQILKRAPESLYTLPCRQRVFALCP